MIGPSSSSMSEHAHEPRNVTAPIARPGQRAVTRHSGPDSIDRRRTPTSTTEKGSDMAAEQLTGRGAALDLADRFMQTWNGHDVDALLGMLTHDITWVDPNLPQPVQGIQAVREFLTMGLRAFPDLHLRDADLTHTSIDGQDIAHAWMMEGTMLGELDPPGFAPTGRRFCVEGVDLWTLRDGRISRYRTYYDNNRIARQLGLMPMEGSRAERAGVVLQRLQARLRSKR
jgi:steroid delta-isomerase-like uncharacterized protein